MAKKIYRWLGLATLIPAQGMIFMDQTILPVALPSIQRELGGGDVALQWCVNSYLLLTAMFSLTGGKIGDRLGHRFTLMLGIIIFIFSSFLCGMSPNIVFLIGARALQGLGAALLIPSNIALFASLFPPNQRGSVMGLNASIGSVFLILGPLIGGYLTESFSWRWIFWINLPLAALELILARIFLPKTPRAHTKIDLQGFIYFAICSASLIIYFMEVSNWGWVSRQGLICATLFLISITLLIRREKKLQQPFLELALFKRPVFAAINISIFIISFILMINVFRAIYFQEVLGYSPTKAGFITFFACLPVLFVAPIGGYLSDRISPKLPIAIGYVMIIFSFLWLAWFSMPSFPSLLFALILFGTGIPLIFTPSYSTAMHTVPPQKIGVAMGIVSTIRTFAGTMGVALIGLFLHLSQARYIRHLPDSSEREKLAEIASFSDVNYVLAFCLLVAFAFSLFLHQRKSTHHLPPSTAEGWD